MAAVVLPVGLAVGGSDFNDLAAHAGQDTAAVVVEAAAAGRAPQAAQPAAGDNARPVAETGPGAAIRGADDAQGQPADSNAPSAPESPKRLHLPRDASAAGTHRHSAAA